MEVDLTFCNVEREEVSTERCNTMKMVEGEGQGDGRNVVQENEMVCMPVGSLQLPQCIYVSV